MISFTISAFIITVFTTLLIGIFLGLRDILFSGFSQTISEFVIKVFVALFTLGSVVGVWFFISSGFSITIPALIIILLTFLLLGMSLGVWVILSGGFSLF